MRLAVRSNKKIALTMAGVATAMLVCPLAGQAEVSGGMGVASMYLWRGQDVSNAAPAVSGNLDYSHESGIFIGTWASSEGVSGSYEWDLYAGWGGKAGPVDLKVGIYEYLYPETTSVDSSGATVRDGLGDSDIAEIGVNATYMDLGVSLFVNTENDYKYLALDYPLDKFKLHVGYTFGVDGNGDADSNADYADLNVNYAFSENASVTLSMATGNAVGDDGIEGDPLVVFSYTVPMK